MPPCSAASSLRSTTTTRPASTAGVRGGGGASGRCDFLPSPPFPPPLTQPRTRLPLPQGPSLRPGIAGAARPFYWYPVASTRGKRSALTSVVSACLPWRGGEEGRWRPGGSAGLRALVDRSARRVQPQHSDQGKIPSLGRKSLNPRHYRGVRSLGVCLSLVRG